MLKTQYHRRQFVTIAASTLAWGVASRVAAEHEETTQQQPRGYFTLGKRKTHWFLIDPQGKPFFTLGLNHIDPSALRYPENIDIWRRKYGASVERWLKDAVRPDFERWGFNTAGWVQEVVTRTLTNHRHSRSFTYEEYQWLGMPYCHMLPFADFHQWEAETRNPDLLSSDFEQWCDFVARQDCAQLADDPKLIDQQTMAMLREMPACVGFHLCGAYLRNRCRRCGLLDERERPDQGALDGITEANRDTARWLAQISREEITKAKGES